MKPAESKTFRSIQWSIHDLIEKSDLPEEFIVHCIQAKWIVPAALESSELQELDNEDIARLRLIRDLQEDFGANDEAIPVILHLIDQIIFLNNMIEKRDWPTTSKEPRPSIKSKHFI